MFLRAARTLKYAFGRPVLLTVLAVEDDPDGALLRGGGASSRGGGRKSVPVPVLTLVPVSVLVPVLVRAGGPLPLSSSSCSIFSTSCSDRSSAIAENTKYESKIVFNKVESFNPSPVAAAYQETWLKKHFLVFYCICKYFSKGRLSHPENHLLKVFFFSFYF
jgi:hypothetical protein